MSSLSGRNFAAGLATLAQHNANPRCAVLARRLHRPVTVAVSGRPGVGVSTVARALAAAGVAVAASAEGDGSDVAGPRARGTTPLAEPGGSDVAGPRARGTTPLAEPGDLTVRVIAEVAKPEDLAVRPAVFVLNKADLAGFGAGGPVAVSRTRAAQLSRRSGIPAEPLVGLLAVAALEPGVLGDDVLGAVRTLVATPADMSSPDAFVAGAHPLPAADRQRLLERLDLFGIAHAALAIDEPKGLSGLLRRISGIDTVCARIEAAAAEVRYRRLLAVVAELEALAVRDLQVERFLAADETVAARTAAAAEVLGADAPDSLRSAVRWRRYGAGPVSALHRACAADLTRGALRAVAG